MGLRAFLTRLWPFGSSDGDGDGVGEDPPDEGTVWDAIPSWQYEGRLAEAGGIARGEQERAVEEIRARAEAEDEVPEWEE
jgi:hypothetical protein